MLSSGEGSSVAGEPGERHRAGQTRLRTEHQQGLRWGGARAGPRQPSSRGHAVFLKGEFGRRLVLVGCFYRTKNVRNEANRHVTLCFSSHPLENCSPHTQKLSLEGQGVGRGEARLGSVVGEGTHTALPKPKRSRMGSGNKNHR